MLLWTATTMKTAIVRTKIARITNTRRNRCIKKLNWYIKKINISTAIMVIYFRIKSTEKPSKILSLDPVLTHIQ